MCCIVREGHQEKLYKRHIRTYKFQESNQLECKGEIYIRNTEYTSTGKHLDVCICQICQETRLMWTVTAKCLLKHSYETKSISENLKVTCKSISEEPESNLE